MPPKRPSQGMSASPFYDREFARRADLRQGRHMKPEPKPPPPPSPYEMRIAQLEGHLKHCENEVLEAKNKLERAELQRNDAVTVLMVALKAEAYRNDH